MALSGGSENAFPGTIASSFPQFKCPFVRHKEVVNIKFVMEPVSTEVIAEKEFIELRVNARHSICRIQVQILFESHVRCSYHILQY